MSEQNNTDKNVLEHARRMREAAMGKLPEELSDPKRPKLDKDTHNNLPPRAHLPPKAQLPPRAQPPPIAKPVLTFVQPRQQNKSYERPILAPRPVVQSNISSTKSIIEVSSKQLENDVLNHITGWKENKFLKDVDYVVNDDIVVLYLSLEFHKIRPGYIEKRVSGMRQGTDQTLRILLLNVDTGDWEKSLAELNAFALFQNLTLVIGWSNSECGEYLQFLKTIRNSTMIKARRTDDKEVVSDKLKFQERGSQFLRCAPRMDKTTSAKLMGKHHTMKKIVSLDTAQLQQVDRMGAIRAKLLFETFNSPFTVAQQNPQLGKR